MASHCPAAPLARPGSPYPVPPPLEMLTWHAEAEAGTVFGIGITLDSAEGGRAPHVVKRVTQALDAHGAPIAHKIAVGDRLLTVDGVDCRSREISGVIDLMTGACDSTVMLEFARGSSAQRYTQTLKRHVQLRSCPVSRGWMQLRPDEHWKGSLLADSAIIDALEGIRQELTSPEGVAIDMLKLKGTNTHTGLEFDSQHPRTVSSIIPASPATGLLQPGDEIVSVDGEDATDSNVQQLLRGVNVVGSTATLRLRRGPDLFTHEITRTSASGMFSCKKLDAGLQKLRRELWLLESHTLQGEGFLDLTRTCIASAVAVSEVHSALEAERVQSETQLAGELYMLCCRLVHLVNEAESKLHQNEIETLHQRIRFLEQGLEASDEVLSASQAREHELGAEVARLNDRLGRMLPVGIHEQIADENKRLHTQLTSLAKLRTEPSKALIDFADEKLKAEISRLQSTIEGMCPKARVAELEDELTQRFAQVKGLLKAKEGLVTAHEYKTVCANNSTLQKQLETLREQMEEMTSKALWEQAVQDLGSERAEVERLNAMIMSMVPREHLNVCESALQNVMNENEQLREEHCALQTQLEMRPDVITKNGGHSSSGLKGDTDAQEVCVRQARIEILEAEVSRLTIDLEALRGSLETMRGDNTRLTETIEQMVTKAEVSAALQTVDSLQKDLSATRIRAQVLELQYSQACEQRAQIQTHAQELSARLDDSIPRSEHVSLLSSLQASAEENSAQARIVAELEGKRSEDQQKIEALEHEISALTSTARGKVEETSALENAERMACELRDRCAQKTSLLDSVSEENETLRKAISAMQQELEALKNAQSLLVDRSEMQAVTERVKTAQRAAQRKDEELAVARMDLQEAQSALLDTQSALESLSAVHAHCVPRSRLTEAEGAGKVMEEELRASRSTIDMLQQTCAHATEENAAIKAEKQVLSERLLGSWSKSDVAALHTAQIAAAEEVHALRKTLESKCAQVTALQTQIQDLTDVISDLRGQLEASLPSTRVLQVMSEQKVLTAQLAAAEARAVTAENGLQDMKIQISKMQEEYKAEAQEKGAALEIKIKEQRLLCEKLEKYKDELATAQARTAASEKHMRTLDEQLASKTRTCCALEKAATELVPLQEVVAARAALREQTSALHACEAALHDERDRAKALRKRVCDEMVPNAEMNTLRGKYEESKAALHLLRKTLAAAGLEKYDVLQQHLSALGHCHEDEANLGNLHSTAPMQATALLLAVRAANYDISEVTILIESLSQRDKSTSLGAAPSKPISPVELAQMVQAMRNGPGNGWECDEVVRILGILNQHLDHPWNANDLSRVRQLLHGVRAESLQDLLDLMHEHADLSTLVCRAEEAEELMLRTKQLASQVAGANRRCQQLSEEKERDLTSWRTLAVERRDEIEKLTARVLALEAPAAPLFATQARKFKGSLVVVLLTTPGNNRIFYTTDGSVPVTDERSPSSSSNFGLAPLAIELTQSSVITAFCVGSGGRASEMVSEEFVLDSSLPRPSSCGVSQVSTSVPAIADKGLAGVGLMLEKDVVSHVVLVSAVPKGGPAETDGRIRVGDRVVDIGDHDLSRLEAPVVQQLLQGEVGSRVTLNLLRHPRNRQPDDPIPAQGEEGGVAYVVTLFRAPRTDGSLDSCIFRDYSLHGDA